MRAAMTMRLAALSILAASTGLTAGCAAGNAPTYGEITAYAETVYDHYQDAAGDRIDFELITLETGNLTDLAGIGVEEFVGVPGEWIRMSQRGTEITALAREPRNPAEDEWQGHIDVGAFEQLGYPLANGAYRLIEVTARLDGVTSSHQALEACWAAREHCIVMDPVVLQADAFAQQRERLLAEGWAPIQVFEREPESERAQPLDAGTAATCSLNSHPGETRTHIDYPAYTRELKNVFGMVLVRKDMGAQRAGVSCFVNGSGACTSAGFGFSDASSCFANLGYTCDCDNTGNQAGTAPDGSSTQSWAESRCTHRAFLDAAVSWSRSGQGASFTIRWDTAGSEDANGGQIFDACGFH